MDLDRALSFAADRSWGVLLTVKADGFPHASNIGYATFDGGIHVSVTENRVKTTNVKRDPRAALHVTSSDFRQWAVLEGKARLTDVTTDPGDEAAALLRRVYQTIAGPHPDWDDFDRAMIADRRLILSVDVTKAYGQGG